MQHSADKQADIRPFAAVCACFTASACTTACSLALPGCAVPPRTAAGHVVQALECTCPCRVRRRISAAQSVARDDASQAAGAARARYFHYVRQEMLKNFASGTQTCGMPMTLPRLVELVRASRSAQLHRVSVADSACPGYLRTLPEIVANMHLHAVMQPRTPVMSNYPLPLRSSTPRSLRQTICITCAPGRAAGSAQCSSRGPPRAADPWVRVARTGAQDRAGGLHALPGQRPVQGARAAHSTLIGLG